VGRHAGTGGLNAESLESGRRAAKQDAAAVLEVAPKHVERRVRLGVALRHLLADQVVGEERADDLVGGTAAQGAGQRQQVAVGPLPPRPREW